MTPESRNLINPGNYKIPNLEDNPEFQEFRNWKPPKNFKPKRKSEEKTKEQTQNQEIPEDWIYIPPINLSFAPEISLKRKNWYEVHREIQEENVQGRMPTTAETWEAIFYARDNLDNPKLKHLYNSILEKTASVTWHGEWQNDFYVQEGDKMYVQHLTGFDANNQPRFSPRTEITDYFPEDGWADIKQKSNITKEGLCKKHTSGNYVQGENIYFFQPRHNSVAGFYADSGGASLDCDRIPGNRSEFLGVRFCAKGALLKNSE